MPLSFAEPSTYTAAERWVSSEVDMKEGGQ